MNFKNKGLIIELTSLLDVIMIMLFWVAANSAQQAENAQQKADDDIKAAQAQTQQVRDELSSQVDEMQRYLDAVNGFEDGEMLTISVVYRDGGDILTFSNGGETILSVELDGNADIEKELRSVLDGLSEDKGKIILAAFVYDGETALYRDVREVRDTLQSIRSDYRGFYFTFVNTGA